MPLSWAIQRESSNIVNSMNIILATDDNFVQHCCVTISSVLKNNTDVNLYILSEGLSDQNKNIISSVVDNLNGNVFFCNVPSKIVEEFPMPKIASSHISIATYYRLFITELLPSEVEKAIYLDCDIVVKGSLKNLWNTDISEYSLGAVYQDLRWSDNENSWGRLGISRDLGYFNAGVLLINIKSLRQNDFYTKALDFIEKHYDLIVSHDQDVLNALLSEDTMPLECKWNFIPLFMKKTLTEKDFPTRCKYLDELNSNCFEPIVIHFVSKPKPWQFGCSHPYRREYYKYLKSTPWSEYKPSFRFKEYYSDVLILGLKKKIKEYDKFNLIDKFKAVLVGNK